MPQPLPIIYADPAGGFVVVDKPAGLLSVPGRGAEHDPVKADCVIARVKEAFPAARGPMVVHRLDMETSGLMVVALNATAQRELSGLFEHRRVEKGYAATLVAPENADPTSGVVRRRFAQLERLGDGEIDAPLRVDTDDRPRQVYDPNRGRSACTRWRLLDVGPDGARVWFEPITGRSHQLRVHAALPPNDEAGAPHGGLGLPIRGDSLYGAGVSVAESVASSGEFAGVARVRRAPRPTSSDPLAHRLELHAAYLRFAGVELGERPF